MKLFRTKNLHYKLVSYIFLAALVFIGVVTFISFRLEINHANQKAEIMINQLMDTVEGTAAIAVYANNSQIAKDVLDGLLRNDVVNKAVIIGDEGLLLEKIKSKQDNKKEIIRELRSPFGDNKSIGQLSITPDTNFSLSEARYAAFSNAINAFILIGLTLLFMLLVIRSLFSKPLIQVSNTLRNIIAGEQERIEPLENNKNDELGRLVVNINKILDLLNTKLSTQQILRKRVESVEKKLRNIFESTSAGLFLLDKEGNILTCTPTLLKILGYEDNHLIAINGQDFATLFFKEPLQFQQMMQTALELEQLEAQDLMLHNNTEENPLWVHCLLSKIIDSFGIIRFEGVIFDISKRIATEKAIQYEANHDALTGLLRRNVAELQLRKHLASANNGSTVVLILDLDGFKKANDTYGHDAGDTVLIETARRLESCVRHNDVVCRLGGDEFLILLFDCTPITTGFSIAEQIIAAIQMPVAIDAQVTITVGVSIGISVFPVHGSNVEELLKSADEAMYEVKRKGKNGYGIKNKNGTIAVNRPFAKK
ncbi:MAG: PAS/PAC sensor-containing diguanylate cyclase [Methylococcaceae bacterium NSP1-2]|nr:diguanylate cyclase [Methylococcaceae bacterium]OYV17166.1 MAG: PAS/PAC sensor-containing diguanylate cyclase [Methylococcaceae bacterium NSP1-2]